MILGGKRNISTTIQQFFTLPYLSLAVQNPFYPSEKTSLVQWFSAGFASGLYITFSIKNLHKCLAYVYFKKQK